MAWWQTAKVGDFIVCVNDDWGTYPYEQHVPKKGVVYSIRGMMVFDSEVGFYINEIHNIPVATKQGFNEVAFHAPQFKPVDPKRLEVFRSLLNPVREDA